MNKADIKVNVLKEKYRYRIMYLYSVLVIFAGLFLGSFREIIDGILKIIVSPSILITDYFVLCGIGASLVNSGTLMLLSTLIAQISKARMSGSLIAAIFTVGGFALFGKNIYNVISIVLGVYLYSLIRKENFSKLITVALFGTSLAPVVNQLSFGMNLNPLIGIALGNIVGIFIGLVLAPLAASFVKFHQGFNLYNIGFTTGIVGMFLMSLFRSTGYNHEIVSNVYLKTDITLTVFLIFYFISMSVFGIIFVKNNFSNYSKLLNTKIKDATDFVELGGFSLVLLNMGVLGIISTIIVLIFKAPLNGPLVGGIFTVVGFGAFGKHPKNALPVMAGAILGFLFMGVSLGTTGAMLTVLFSTTLVPIAGHYGNLAGIIAGLIHASLISNTGYLHGGMNLYNNGFTGGFVAAVLVLLLQTYKKQHTD
ncbi:MAG TPA: DUF1576 domain-containing protein [Christensenellaceae bacterium]|jgi:hypothetical protein|nr:DUF1576 domain-containing protein [Christensenellaceae bacterium]